MIKSKKLTVCLLCAVLISQLFLPLISTAATIPTVSIGSIEAKAGETCKIPVYIKNNTGLLTVRLCFNYDAEVLTPVSVECGEIISGGLEDNIDSTATAGDFYVNWASSGYELTQDGIFMYVNFQVSSDALKNTVINLSYSQEDTCDDDFNDVVLNTVGGEVKITAGYSKFYSGKMYDATNGIDSTSAEISAGDMLYITPFGNSGSTNDGNDITKYTCHIGYDSKNFTFMGYATYNKDSLTDFEPITGFSVVNDGDVAYTLDLSGNKLTCHEGADAVVSLAKLADNQEICLMFKSNDGAFTGDYTFTGSISDFEGVEFATLSDFSVKVKKTATSEVAEIFSDAIYGSCNDEIDIPLYISNNHGIMGYQIGIEYDATELQIVSTSSGTDFSGTYNDNAGDVAGKMIVNWNTIEDNFTDGVLLTLKFKILSDSVKKSTIKVSYSQENTFNEKYEDVIFNTNDITVNMNTTDPDFIIKTVSLSLESSVTMNFKVLKTAVKNYSDLSVRFNCAGLEETVVTEYTEQGDYYVFSYTGVSPQMMNDEVTAILTARYGVTGKTYSTPEKTVSVKFYVYTMLDRYGSASYAKMRTLLVDLLNYGTAAQIYRNYETATPVNADLTDTQKAWGTTKTYQFNNIKNFDYKTIDSPTVVWTASGLVLSNSVMVRAKFKADSIQNKTVKITCGGRELVYQSESFVDNGDGTYYVYCNDLYANEMSQSITLTVYDNGVQCSNTMLYSIESYASAVQTSSYKGTALDDLTQAMMRYGKSAEAYRA